MKNTNTNRQLKNYMYVTSRLKKKTNRQKQKHVCFMVFMYAQTISDICNAWMRSYLAEISETNTKQRRHQSVDSHSLQNYLKKKSNSCPNGRDFWTQICDKIWPLSIPQIKVLTNM